MLGSGRHTMLRSTGEGQFTCPNARCESHADPDRASYRQRRADHWFRFLFVPLLVLDSDPDVVECDQCGVVLPAPLATADGYDDVACREATCGEAAGGARPNRALANRADAGRAAANREDVAPSPTTLTISMLGTRLADRADSVVAEVVSPEPPQRPACKRCGLCGTPRAIGDDLCDSCGAVFLDRSERSCARHKISLPTDADCPVCGPDGISSKVPVVARTPFFG